jgi:hypothetical protein
LVARFAPVAAASRDVVPGAAALAATTLLRLLPGLAASLSPVGAVGAALLARLAGAFAGAASADATLAADFFTAALAGAVLAIEYSIV